MFRILVCTLLLCFPFASMALAGAVFTMEATMHSSDEVQTMETRLTVEGQNLKMSVSSSEAGAAHDMIFKGGQQEIVAVSHPERIYVVMDRESMKSLQGQMDEAMSQMKKALEDMPEDQRAMAEKMMKGMADKMPMPGADTPKPSLDLRKTGETEKVGAYDCTKYEVLRDGSLFQNLWVTDWKNVEGGEEMGPALREFAAFLKDTLGSMAGKYGFDLEDGPFAAWEKIDGCPVKSEQFENGEAVAEAILTSAHEEDVDASAFDPPADYDEQSMPTGHP